MISARQESLGGYWPNNESYEFQGKTNPYTIHIFRSNHEGKKSFTEIPEYDELVKTVTGLYFRVYPNRNKTISEQRIKEILGYPRSYLLVAEYKGEPIGFGAFPRINIPMGLSRPAEPALSSSRAFLKEHERQGLGSHLLEKAIELHQEELSRLHRPALRWGIFITMNPGSIASTWRVPSIGETYPIARPAVEGGDPTLNLYPEKSDAQSIMLGMHQLFRVSSTALYPRTGVSEGEFQKLGMNETYRPEDEESLSYKVYDIMIKKLRVNREAGDEVYVTYEIKKPSKDPVVDLAA